MSQELRNKQGGSKDINHFLYNNGVKRNYDGFEGMNYEQIRQPYNPKYLNRNRTQEERNNDKRSEKE